MASERIAFDDPMTWSGRGSAAKRSATGRGRMPRARAARRSRRRRAGRAEGTARSSAPHPGDGLREIGEFVGAAGDLERAAADVEQQDLARRPPEPAPHGEVREARLGFAPEHLQGLAERLLDESDDLLAVRRVAHGGGRRGEEFVDPLGAGPIAGGGHGIHQSGDPLGGDRTVGLQVAHEAQHRAVRARRGGATARAGVGHQEVDGVRADVEDSQAHGPSVAGRPIGGRTPGRHAPRAGRGRTCPADRPEASSSAAKRSPGRREQAAARVA